MKPEVSIIVPNYNHASFLEKRLSTIYEQTFDSFEVILLDDCSTDGSREILDRYRDHPKTTHCIYNEKNSGNTFKQWNKGLSLAKGKFIWIAETDDFCEPIFLEKLVNLLINNEDVSLAYCQSHRVDLENKLHGSWISQTYKFKTKKFENDFVMDGNLFIEKFLIHTNVIPNVSAVLFRKQSLEPLLPLVFEPFMKYNADWLYYIQLICNTKVGFVADSLNYFRFHDTSVIARASEVSGWAKICDMELTGRAFSRDNLRKQNPDNLRAIISESLKGDQYLKKQTVSGCLKRKERKETLKMLLKFPDFTPFALKYLFKKLR